MDDRQEEGEAITPETPERAPSNEVSRQKPVPEVPPVVDVRDLDWAAIAERIDPPAIRAKMRAIVDGMEAILDRSEVPLLFSPDTKEGSDRAPQLAEPVKEEPLWFIGDLHGDWLALEAALSLIGLNEAGRTSRIIFLGDVFDDGGFELETLLRVFELILERPDRICVVAGNHDEALSYDASGFSSSTRPADFADYLNANLVHEWIERSGRAAIRLFDIAPRALFFPDGLLVAHGGFPLSDLHPALREKQNWNDPACLADFVWTRAHPTAPRKLPNRYNRGSQFGHRDFADFCALATELGRPVTHMVRGHDHVEERYAIYSAYAKTPMLTTVALSRRLGRELMGPPVRVPTIARYIEGALPQVHRLHIPPELVDRLYPASAEAIEPADGDRSPHE